MARRTPAQRNEWNTWSQLRARGPAKINLCKIDTGSFRHMTADQLQLAHTRVGWGALPKAAETKAARADNWRKIPTQGLEINALLGRYIEALREIRKPDFLSRENTDEYWRRHPQDRGVRITDHNREAMAVGQKIAALKAERDPRVAAERIERQIWDLQARAACPIKPDEQIARDADREGRHREAARIRKKPIIR